MIETWQFDTDFYPSRILLVGVGGTGAQWARSIARMLWELKEMGQDMPRLILIDPDVVEEKNVGRQLFTPADVGQPKASIIARRLAWSLGIEVECSIEPFDCRRHMMGHEVLLCGAVDNHLAREAMFELFELDGRPRSAPYDVMWIDAGNHLASGQVIIGNTHDVGQIRLRRSGNDGEKLIANHLPYPPLVMPGLLEPEEEPEQEDLSCAELVATGDQHLLINDLMATVAAGYTYKILHRQPIDSFMTYVDVDGLTVRSLPITPGGLESYLGQPVTVDEPVKLSPNGHGGSHE